MKAFWRKIRKTGKINWEVWFELFLVSAEFQHVSMQCEENEIGKHDFPLFGKIWKWKLENTSFHSFFVEFLSASGVPVVGG